jgi:hypothetical protein
MQWVDPGHNLKRSATFSRYLGSMLEVPGSGHPNDAVAGVSGRLGGAVILTRSVLSKGMERVDKQEEKSSRPDSVTPGS